MKCIYGDMDRYSNTDTDNLAEIKKNIDFCVDS